ncbi:MAG TPA: hypothetical protein EYN89_00635, partial [Flavobacteriales bacterium]|nr:hypothetical protein [Flavobacteriales bacterium]
MDQARYNWKQEEIEAIFNVPLLDLVYRAANVHRQFHNPREVQVSSLISIKTGGCIEDCAYCPQAARYFTLNKHKSVDDYQYGGGAGMVLMIEPIARCIERLSAKIKYDEIIYMSP